MRTIFSFSKLNFAGRFLPVLLLAILPAVAQAQFGYITANGQITITGYLRTIYEPVGPVGALTIPGTINGLPVTGIGNYAFAGSSALTSVTIPNSVTSIGFQAFAGCASLGSVTIGSGVTSIGIFAFLYCDHLTNVTIPNSVVSIEDYAFRGCLNLSAITVDELNSFYSSVDGVLFDKSQVTLIQCPVRKAGGYAVPDGVLSIGSAAFEFCDRLTTITIPDSVTRIGSVAFGNCYSLTRVTIGNGVTNIGDVAFGGCHALAAVFSRVTLQPLVTNSGTRPFLST